MVVNFDFMILTLFIPRILLLQVYKDAILLVMNLSDIMGTLILHQRCVFHVGSTLSDRLDVGDFTLSSAPVKRFGTVFFEAFLL